MMALQALGPAASVVRRVLVLVEESSALVQPPEEESVVGEGSVLVLEGQVVGRLEVKQELASPVSVEEVGGKLVWVV